MCVCVCVCMCACVCACTCVQSLVPSLDPLKLNNYVSQGQLKLHVAIHVQSISVDSSLLRAMESLGKKQQQQQHTVERASPSNEKSPLFYEHLFTYTSIDKVCM